MTAPLPGRLARPWCPHCHAPPGPDCPNRSTSKRQTRRWLARELRTETQEITEEKS